MKVTDIIKIITFLFLLPFILNCCKPQGDCKEYLSDMRGDQCLLIVKTIPGKLDGRFAFKGINPYTKKECDCDSDISDMWWSTYKKYILIGDTIIKRKGSLVFNIHKKDTVLSFKAECDIK